LEAGADGVVSGVAAAVPELPVAMQRAQKAGDTGLSARLAARLDDFLPWTDRFPATIAIKEAAEMRRWIRSSVALPLSPATQERLLAFRGWFEAWLPETLALSATPANTKS
jgi:dihydrodipicolinate synthase/N-acetylneuraminate lyase